MGRVIGRPCLAYDARRRYVASLRAPQASSDAPGRCLANRRPTGSRIRRAPSLRGRFGGAPRLATPPSPARYPSAMPPRTTPLPADDPDLAALTLDELELRWADAAARTPITAEAMTGADRKAQAIGIARRAADGARGDGRRRRGARPRRVQRARGQAGPRPGRPRQQRRRRLRRRAPARGVGDARHRRPRRRRTSAPAPPTRSGTGSGSTTSRASPRSTPRSPATSRSWGRGSRRRPIVVDALLGTGVRGQLREPVRTAVEIIRKAREAGIPVLAVDTPDRRRPHLGRPVGPRRPRGPHGDLPPPEDRAPHADGPRARRPRPGRPDRHPARGGPGLGDGRRPASPACARSCSSPPRWCSTVAGRRRRHRAAARRTARPSSSTPRC